MYREQLRKLDTIALYHLVCAAELEYFSDHYDFTLSNKDFDAVVDFMYKWCYDSDSNIKPDDLASVITRGIMLEELKIEDYYADYRVWVEYIKNKNI